MKAAYDLMLKKKAERENDPADNMSNDIEEEEKVGEDPAVKMNK